MTVGAIVVNHNAGESLSMCVASLVGANVDEIVVVDNDSRDRSLEILSERFPEISIIETGKNLGYGSAANVGRRALHTDLLFICNPDLVVDAGAPSRLVEYLAYHEEVGVVGPRVYETDESVYPSARAFPSITDAVGHGLFSMFWPDNPFSRRYKFAAVDATLPILVDWVSGACMMVRSDAFDAIDGFDERYFMYVEDLDLCWRLRRAGWRCAYVPAASVVHHGGLSSIRRPYRMLVAHHASTWRFARTSLTGARRVLLPLVGLGIAARLVVALVRQFARP